MSDDFWCDLSLTRPYIAFEVGRDAYAEWTASVMLAYEWVCLDKAPDWAVVAGDGKSILACALTAKNLGVHVGHLETGL